MIKEAKTPMDMETQCAWDVVYWYLGFLEDKELEQIIMIFKVQNTKSIKRSILY